jgi:serine/threonine protein kinase
VGRGGQGSAAIVRRWKDPADKMLLIMKMNNCIDDYDIAKEEAKRLREYDHENIVKVVDTFDYLKNKLHAIIMEFCNGKHVYCNIIRR